MNSGDATPFYSVQLPEKTVIPETIIIEPYYTNREDALAILKKLKPARMKIFASREEAENFHNEPDNMVNADTAGVDSPVSSSPGMEALSYSSVRFQDLVKLRQAIEKGETAQIHELVNSNPRYLIASGDTPTILQERFRYNALHSAAIKGQAAAAEVILNYLSSPELFVRLFPADPKESQNNRMSFILDLYLNTPDKGFNETPLHFAAKYGHISMVELLVNETVINKNAVNKEGQTAAEIVCTRINTQTNKKRILEILKGQFYIPLYRSVSDDVAPVVGEPWTPDSNSSTELKPPSPAVRAKSSANITCITSPLRCVHQHQLPQIHPPNSANQQRLTATGQMMVKAVAGPMSPQQAQLFKRNWSSPGATRSPVLAKNRDSPLKFSARRDPYKGLELIGRSIAAEMDVSWTERWDFLDCSVNLRLPEGLKRLDDYIRTLESLRSTPAVLSPLARRKNDKVAGVHAPAPHQGDGDGENVPTTPETSQDRQTDRGHPNPSTPSDMQCDKMNTTDEELSSMFSTLTINSPTAGLTKLVNTRTSAASGDVSGDGQSPHGDGLHSNGAAVRLDRCMETGATPLKPRDMLVISPHHHSSRHNVSPRNTPRRSVMEYIMPSIAPYMDKLRMFWPFGKGGLTPHKSASTSPTSATEHIALTSTDFSSDAGALLPPDSIIETKAPSLIHTPPVKSETRPKVFIQGAKPCKVDTDVLKALHDVVIDESLYPSLYSWHTNVTSHSEQDQESWKSPVALRYRARCRRENTTPKRRVLFD